jgi:uncharacterized Tic20 family protein
MSIGVSLFLIAAGAILRYAVTAQVENVDLDTVGLILMVVGFAGLILSIVWMAIYANRGQGGRRPPDPPAGPPGY